MASGLPSSLFRIPPFRRTLPVLAVPASGGLATPENVTEVTRRIVTDRIGGTFWAAAPLVTRRVIVCTQYDGTSIKTRILARLLDHLATVRAPSDIMLVAPGPYGPAARIARKYGIAHVQGHVDPHALLDHAQEIHELGQGQIGDLAALRGLAVTRYASPDRGHHVDGTQVARRLIDDWQYYEPYTRRPVTIEKIMDIQALWRRTLDANHQIGACMGMSRWKRNRIADFFTTPPTHPPFIAQAGIAVRHCAHQHKAIVSWATRMPPDLTTLADAMHVPVWRVEDGFIRSVGLGSGLQVPASIFVDRRGIYYDPSEPSDLEHILATETFDHTIRERARSLIDHVVRNGISKYGRSDQGRVAKWHAVGRRVLLVPGQVSDDQSVLKGGGAIQGNIELLKAVRAHNPDAFIIYRPHPDVVAGHRAGKLTDEAVLAYADHINLGGSITDMMTQADEIHTLTSLAGFEALMRQRKVVTYGCPFYAGWGLTTDMGQVPVARRRRSLQLEELVAGALIRYPRYVDPVTHIPCEVETVIERFDDMQAWRPTLLMRITKLQGWLNNYFVNK